MDANNAASSPAPVDSQEVLNSMSVEQRTEWRATGKLPEAPKTEESAPSTAPEKAEEAEIAPESEPGKEVKQEPAGKPVSAAEKRIKQLLSRIKELESTPAASQREPIEVKPKVETKVEAAEDPKKPKQADFESYDEFTEALIDWKATQKLEGFKSEQEKAAKQAETAKALKAAEDAWTKRVDAAKKKHADFEEIAFNKDLKIPEGSVMDAFILESEKGTEVLYHLGKNPAEAERIAALGPLAQARALFEIEVELSKEAPIRQIKSVPDPPLEVGGKNAAPADEIEAALKNGDMPAYRRLMNAKELNARKA